MDLILKQASEEQQMVWGEVYAPGIPDSDNDMMDADAIREMAYKFMREKKTDRIDIQHDNKTSSAYVIESFIARKDDKVFIPGAWVVGVHIPDKGTWNMVKKGEINGFSMEALVTKVAHTLELELPPVIEGMVVKHEDGHDHEFFVAYDEEGKFLGGRTSKAEDGHWHVIKRGTLTEPSSGHHHVFSYVEKLVGVQ